MKQYHKIQTVFKRDEKTKRIIVLADKINELIDFTASLQKRHTEALEFIASQLSRFDHDDFNNQEMIRRILENE